MADDLQRLVDSTLQSSGASLGGAPAMPEEETDDSHLSPEEKKAKADLRKEIEGEGEASPQQKRNDEPLRPPTPQEIAEAVRLHKTRAPESKEITAEIIPRPKTIADLLHLEAEVAKNPPRSEPAGTSKIRENLKNITVTQKTESSILKRIRTFKSDVADAMSTGKSTYIGIATAQLLKNKKDEVSQETLVDKSKGIVLMPATQEIVPKKDRVFSTLAITLSVLLIVVGLAGVGYITYVRGGAIAPPTEQTSSSNFVTTQFETVLETDRKNPSYLRSAIAAERKDAPGTLNNLGNIKFVQSKDADPQVTLTTTDFIAALGMNPPSELLRTLDPNFMLGIHRFPENQSFLIFKTDTYETARDALREWENGTLEGDVGKLLRAPSDFNFTTGSSTTLTRQSFLDRVLKNKDCRVLLNRTGEVVFFYTFIDRTYIVFGSNPETLSAILSGFTSRTVTK